MSSNKLIALVTGANKGIGLEAVRQLSSAGYKVLLGARDITRGEEAVATLKSQGIDTEFLHLDVSDEANIQAAVKVVSKNYGHLDVLVNNAGVISESWNTKPSEISLKSLHATLDANLDGVIRVTNNFLPLLKLAEKARIINVSSTWGSLKYISEGQTVVPSYHISKAALNMWTVMLANELKDQSISVNSVCPGWVQTDMGTSAAPRTVDQGAAIITKLATQKDVSTGGYFDDAGTIAW